MTHSQMTLNVIQQSLKTDYHFNYKEFDFGGNFQGRQYNGIFEIEELQCYLVYGNEFYY